MFSTRNSDGASSLSEPHSTISDSKIKSIQSRAIQHEIEHEGGLFGEAATRRRAAHDTDKAGTN